LALSEPTDRASPATEEQAIMSPMDTLPAVTLQ